MKFSASLFVSAVAFFAASVSAAPSTVWDPTITSPIMGTVWTVGTTVNVTWSTTDQPSIVSNAGQIFLAKDQVQMMALSGEFDLAAADGSYPVTVPVVAPGDDYQVVLFGDSGNIGPSFVIAV
ncbi:hypothetical protein J3R30DRAFT_3429683 [Lentinula aciculospora]|uniref:Ser-Thr-rich glycosyl-phosphatidyl-inositol-anchored membrane family-domain-containing protein n=1 Tax=Lentinula aciculospora TaxID=153920 RepID=A0A9W9DNS9_9AGAR|nr:hypothetical protein J3R30DRAFT_3482374 [Lentinula aciculospora]KAJ4487600.1 hypothetical protein J3R30DRAFT_3429683 [Lentinula aciculospora]